MTRMLRIAYVLAIGALVATAALASPITVDGNDTDWTSPVSTGYDANGDVDISGYDIDVIYSDYDATSDRLAFMARTVAPMQHIDLADRVEFIFNADGDTTTGSSNWQGLLGADFRFVWELDGAANVAYDSTSGSNQPYFYDWSTNWSFPTPIAASDFQIAWGNSGTDYSIIECTVNPSLIGNPDSFVWGVYLDNGGTSSDDYAQAEVGGDSETPEPATWVLLAATAAFGALRRRRD